MPHGSSVYSKLANMTKRTQGMVCSAHHLLNSAAVATQDTGTCIAASYGREAPTHAPGLVLDAMVRYLADARDGFRELGRCERWFDTSPMRLNFDFVPVHVYHGICGELPEALLALSRPRPLHSFLYPLTRWCVRTMWTPCRSTSIWEEGDQRGAPIQRGGTCLATEVTQGPLASAQYVRKWGSEVDSKI